MNRLTERDFKFTSNYVAQRLQAFPMAQCLSKLQEYEDAEEQGLLVRLPCKMGSNVWLLMQRNLKTEVLEVTVKDVRHYDDGTWWLEFSDIWIDKQFEDFGKTVFLTKEDAEKELAERNEQNE